jgi:hypothetical protein
MKRIQIVISVMSLLLCAVLVQAQVVTTNTNVVVPPLVNFSGKLTDSNGKPLTGSIAVTFSLYSEQTGGAALWMETQNVQPDARGHYNVTLGSTSSTGLPADIFVAGQAHWLGVQVEGEAYEQPRVLLLSVPYALKAGDAQTLGGMPASAFMLAAPPSAAAAPTGNESTSNSSSSSVTPATSSDVTTSGGTVNALPLFSTATNIQNSLLTQTGTTAINVGGKLNLPPTGAASATAGKNSQPQDFVASAFSSSTSTPVSQTFQWQAEPAGNNTASPSSTLNLLYGLGATAPTESGLKVGSNGVITFAPGQTFPGTGPGTITEVSPGSGLTGGGSSGDVTLTVDPTKVPFLAASNAFTGNQMVTGTVSATSFVGSGAGITGVNASELSGLPSTGFAHLATNNTFAKNQTINGSLTVGDGLDVGASGGNQALFVLQLGTSSDGLRAEVAGSGNGLVGNATTGSGVVGNATTGSAVLGNATTGTAVYGDATSGFGVVGFTTSSTALSVGVEGQVNSTAGYGVEGVSPYIGVYGNSSGALAYGVYGASSNVGVFGNGTGPGGIGVDGHGNLQGVKGVAVPTTGVVMGVYGQSSSPSGFGVKGAGLNVGVYGTSSGTSATGSGRGNAGVWGDTGGGAGDGFYGVLGTADSNSAGGFVNNSEKYPTLYAVDNAANEGILSGPDPPVIESYAPNFDAICAFYAIGAQDCSATISSSPLVDKGTRRVSLYSVQSPNVWYEDAGSGQLSHGSTTVTLDSTFAQTVNTGIEYHVFLTPNGDCKGLYVTNKTATTFEVRELGGGNSNIAFDYRIMAKRAGYENKRLEDVTERYRAAAQMAHAHDGLMTQRSAANAIPLGTAVEPESPPLPVVRRSR